MPDDLPLYRVYLRRSSRGRTILAKEYDVTDLGNDLKAVLDELERLRSENAALAESNRVLTERRQESVAVDSEDSEQLARLRALRQGITPDVPASALFTPSEDQ